MTQRRPDGPFDTLEATFRLACAGPEPWSINGSAVPGLPDREILLDELRAMLLHPSTGHHTRNAAVSVLVGDAQRDGGPAMAGLAGVLLPGLRRAVGPLSAVCPARTADLQAEALVGLIEGVGATAADHPALAARLCWLARNRAKRLFDAELAVSAASHQPAGAEAPPLPCAHPDLILAHAVAERVIHRDDAALIGDTRLGLVSLEAAATTVGISRAAALKRRRRAEQTLAAWLSSDDYHRQLFVRATPPEPYSRRRGRPRGSTRAGRRLSRPPVPPQGGVREDGCDL
jgi:hypothetical protein